MVKIVCEVCGVTLTDNEHDVEGHKVCPECYEDYLDSQDIEEEE